MEFSWSEEDQAFRDRLRDVIEGALPQKWQDMIPGEEATSAFTVEFSEMLAAEGLLTPHWPSEYGGRDASGWQFIILGEELWSAGEPRGSQYMNVNWVGPAIMIAGTRSRRITTSSASRPGTCCGARASRNSVRERISRR